MLKNKMHFVITLLIGMIALVGCSGSNTDNNQQEEPKETVQESTIVEVKTITVEDRTDEG